jgi:hypothetical protein
LLATALWGALRKRLCSVELHHHLGHDPDGGGSVFAPVIVEAVQGSSATTLAPRTSGSSVIEIVIGAASVRVSRGIDAATLATVLRAVKAAT